MNAPRNPQEIMASARGFMESRILLTAGELDLFTKLAEPASAMTLAGANGWHERPLIRLLDALVSMELLEKKGDHYQTPPPLLPALRSDDPNTILPMIRHAATIWNNWSNLTSIVTDTGGVTRQPAMFKSPEDAKAFINAMHAVGSVRADSIVKAIDSGQAKHLLDVGGASGTYTMAFLKANPDLKATIFDLPPVVEMARERLATNGYLGRVTLVPGDFYRDDLPHGHDLALLSAVIHQNSDSENVNLYCKVFHSLLPGGRIVIRDHIMSPDRTHPKSGALFAINMLVATPGGKTYTLEEIESELKDAGFIKIRLIQEDAPMMGLVEAYKPEE